VYAVLAMAWKQLKASMAVLLTPPDTEWVGLYRDALPSGSMDMSMQLSAMPAAKTLAVTEALAAPAAGVWPGSLKTDAHSPAADESNRCFTVARHISKSGSPT